MGTARKIRKKFQGPRHPFNQARFEEELKYMGEYGLRNKRELYKARTRLGRYRSRARDLLGLEPDDPLRMREEKLLLDKMVSIGVLKQESVTLDMVLGLSLEDFLERRLQTQVYRRGLAASPHQARQMVVHGHVALEGRKVTIPSYHLTPSQAELIDYAPSSPYRNDEHALRKELLMLLEKTEEPAPEPEPKRRRERY